MREAETYMTERLGRGHRVAFSPFAYCVSVYSLVTRAWILLGPDGSHFKQQDQDAISSSSMKEWRTQNRSTRPYDIGRHQLQHGQRGRKSWAGLGGDFLFVSFFFPLRPERDRKQKLNEENKSMTI